jgi:transcription initiation factor TFIID subunit 5
MTVCMAATPSSQSPVAPSPANPPQDSAPNVSLAEQAILEYLRSRGHSAAEKAFLNDIEAASPDGKGKQAETISVDELVKTLAVFAQKPSRPGENIFKDSASVLQELTAMGNPTNIQNLIASIGSVGAEEILSLDPTDKQEGFRELEAWVDGSLDMYRVRFPCYCFCGRSSIVHWQPEFRPILFPIFCHFYLDLIQHGFKDAGTSNKDGQYDTHNGRLALRFFSTFSPSLSPSHNKMLHHISTLLLPSHVLNDELAQRFRNEKYTVRMSRSGFSLLVGWLTEGVGGEPFGAGSGFSGEQGKRGRASVMRVVNNHLRFDGNSYTVGFLFIFT